MDQQTALERLAKRAARAPRAPAPIHTDASLLEDVERVLQGERAIDVIEMHIDDEAVQEISTAASVGSGVAKGVGRHHPTEDEQLKKILKRLEGYKRHEGLSELRPYHVVQFAEESGLPESLGEKLLDYLKRRGDV